MKITTSLFEAFLKCPTKCCLRATNEPPSGNEYAEWVKTQNESYRVAETERLRSQTPPDDFALSPPVENLKAAQWRLAVDVVTRTPAQSGSVVGTDSTPSQESQERGWNASLPAILESHLHAVERVPSEGRGKAAQLIPIRFIFFNKLTKDDKLLLAFDTFVLSAVLGREIAAGKIIHGDVRSCARESAAISHEPSAGQPARTTSEITTAAPSRAQPQVLKVKTSALAGEMRKRLEKMIALLSSPAPPDLVLNRHCGECEFQARCRKIAIEKDDLSLLAGMSAKERQKFRSKGIFTVNQLSYTFRPRRTPKGAKNPAKPHYLPLKALSLRENTVYIHGNPQMPASKSQVYLDIEGLPDTEFYYLIGALIVSAGQETFHAFWADTPSDELTIFANFVQTICQLPDFRILHYGGYETVALRRMQTRLPCALHPQIETILERATNVLSVVHPHIYLPTHSNGLKDIGRFLGCKRTYENATGLLTIVWRKFWEETGNPNRKFSLLQYNEEDCRDLKHVCQLIERIANPETVKPASSEALPMIARTGEMLTERPHWNLFRPIDFVSDDFKHVNKCAYFDYQREKVFVRTHRQFKIINKSNRKRIQAVTRPNETVQIECERCPRCQKKSIKRTETLSRLLIDLKFSKTGMKRWITKFYSYRYKCHKCQHLFGSEIRRAGTPYRYGHGFMSWCVYTSFFCDMKMSRTRIAVGDAFEIFVDDSRMMRARQHMTGDYEPLYTAILQSLLQEKVIHIDETTVQLTGSKGYVWVIASMDKVYYFYRPTREGMFLAEMLSPFSGVLVSDFYTAYDSLNCEQQKCLVHFVRDVNEDVLKNPLDAELKGIAQEFGTLLRTIVEWRLDRPAVF